MTALFRPEAIDGQRQSWLGGVLLIRPLSLTLLTLGTVSAAALLVGYLFVGEYTQQTRLSGVLAAAPAGVIGLVAPQAATLLERHAQPGQAVRRGDLLFVLSAQRMAELHQTHESAPRQRLEVRAPADGVLAEVQAAPGHQLPAMAPLVNLLPTTATLQAQLLAPAGVIGLLQPQQSVQLHYPALAAPADGPYAGRVLEVSRTPLPGGDAAGLDGPAAAERVRALGGEPRSAAPLYRVTVAIDRQAVSSGGVTQALAAGMLLEADVRLQRRRLIDWLFQPAAGRSAPI